MEFFSVTLNIIFFSNVMIGLSMSFEVVTVPNENCVVALLSNKKQLFDCGTYSSASLERASSKRQICAVCLCIMMLPHY